MTEIERKRLAILRLSLSLEKATSFLIGIIFDIEDFKNTKSFGNQSTALSFNQKILLLLDYKAIDKKDKVKFDIVMNIRNQFLHNADCISYQEAFNSNDGLENKIKKLYPDLFNLNDNEKSLELGVTLAYEECMGLFSNPVGGFANKFLIQAERQTYLQIIDVVRDNANSKFIEFGMELHNDSFDYRDKVVLLERIVKLKNEVFDISELTNLPS